MNDTRSDYSNEKRRIATVDDDEFHSILFGRRIKVCRPRVLLRACCSRYLISGMGGKFCLDVAEFDIDFDGILFSNRVLSFSPGI